MGMNGGPHHRGPGLLSRRGRRQRTLGERSSADGVLHGLDSSMIEIDQLRHEARMLACRFGYFFKLGLVVTESI